MGYTPRVLVVGGGAVGTGVARDLAIRGLEVTLVERGPLAAGTSGSMHALLHSGARYAVDEPDVAAACRRESATLRRIGDHLIAATGGLFVRVPDGDSTYPEEHRAACESVGLEVEVLSGDTAREHEPTIGDDIERAMTVPDGVIDPFALCAANAVSAQDHGAAIRTNAEVTDVRRSGDAIDTVELCMGPDSSVEEQSPDFVVNAAGPWAGHVAGLAGYDVPIRHVQGAMLAVDRSGLSTVVNRWRPPDEGDIAVPFGPSAVLGTTARPIDGPDAVSRDPGEVDRLVDELQSTLPTIANAAPRRAFWGVRALAGDAEPTAGSRSATLIDHEARDGVWGLLSVFGGKLTTHRATAERVADHVCEAFGIRRQCRTAEIDLPAVPPADGTTGATVGADPVLCESENVTRSEFRAVLDHDVLGEDVRTATRLTRAGMGCCQGGRCAHRLAAQTDQTGAVEPIDDALATFADDRWAGRRHAIWGAGAAGALSTYDFHARLVNRDRDPPEWDRFAGEEATDE